MSTDNRKLKKASKGNGTGYYIIMLFPFLIFFFLFTVLPVVSSIVLSFFTYDTISFPKWSGLGNYFRMFIEDEVFSKTILNTLKFSIVTGPFSFLLGFVLAWFISEFRPLVRNILSFLFYLPALVGGSYFVWQIAFSGDSYGYVNNFLLSIGFIDTPINWFRNTSYNFIIIVIVQLWSSMGVSFLADIAGLQNVNPELYEAGALDGISTRWHELWYITLPSMKEILLFGAVMQIQATFSIGTSISALAGYPSIDNSVDTIVTYMGDIASTRYEMGYAAALSVILFIIMAVTRVVVGKILDFLGK